MSNILEVKNLRVWFPIRHGILNLVSGHVKAVDDVSLTIAEGETLGLVGESGCGKTTLGRAVLGLEKVHSGQVLFEGHDFTAMPESQRRQFRRRCQMIFQDPYASLNPRMTAMELVTEGLKHHGLLKDETPHGAAVRLMREVGLDDESMYRYREER